MMTNKIIRSDGTTQITGIKSCVYTEAVNATTDLRPGCVGSAMIEVEVYGTQTDAPTDGERLAYYQTDSNGTDTLIGYFYAEPAITTRNTYRFTAYDAASKLDTDFSATLKSIQSSFPMTISSLVQRACTVAGVSLASNSWTRSTQSVAAFYADGISCRDIVSWAAEIACQYVRCNTSGALVFGWYSAVSYRIAPSSGTNVYPYKQDGLNYENYATAAVTSVKVKPVGTSGAAYSYPASVASDTNQLVISENLLLTSATSTVMNAVAQGIYTAMAALPTWRPATVRLFPFMNPFRVGNIVSVTDSQGVTFNTLVMKMSVSTDAATVSSSGNKTYSDYESGSNKSLANLAANIIQLEGDVVFKSNLTDGTTTISGSNITTGTISASRIDTTDLHVSSANIDGTISVGNLSTTVVTSSSSKTQYYLSTSDTTATGGTWQDTVPSWSSGKYIWTRLATTDTLSDDTTNTTNSTAQYDSNLTTALSTAASASTAASGANSQTQIIYISKVSGTSSVSATTTWITNTTGNQNTWTLKRPTYDSSYPVLFTATQQKTVGGTVTCTTPLKDDTTTVIDGGHITTGSIDASRITTGTLDATQIGLSGAFTVSATSGDETQTCGTLGGFYTMGAGSGITLNSDGLIIIRGYFGSFSIGDGNVAITTSDYSASSSTSLDIIGSNVYIGSANDISMSGNVAIGSSSTNYTLTLNGQSVTAGGSTVPTNHASTATTYGVGDASNYGHLKLSASTSSTSGTSGGIAATPSAVKSAYDLADSKSKFTTLWTNSSPTTARGSFTLSSAYAVTSSFRLSSAPSNYDAILIEYAHTTSSSSARKSETVLYSAGRIAWLSYIDAEDGLFGAFRTATINSTTIVFSTCYDEAEATQNGQCIPTAVIGIKF